MPRLARTAAAAALALLGGLPAAGQGLDLGARIERDGEGGRMTMAMPDGGAALERPIGEELTFAPWEMLDELARDDVVLLMRHGKTDWSKRDASDVAPGDCDNQRVMTEDGKREMFELGALLAANDLTPGHIVVSDWCRNQQTLAAMREGIRAADPDAPDDMPVETMSELNLLLALQGAPDVAAMRDYISAWDGGAGEGPLLVISHFTNIQELTQQSVFEGQMLLLDPDQSNRVLGTLLLGSAGPDVGHFQDEVDR